MSLTKNQESPAPMPARASAYLSFQALWIFKATAILSGIVAAFAVLSFAVSFFSIPLKTLPKAVVPTVVLLRKHGGVLSAGFALFSCSLMLVTRRIAETETDRLSRDLYLQHTSLQKMQAELRVTRTRLETTSEEAVRLAETNTALERQVAREGEKVDRQLILLEAAVEASNDVMMIAMVDEGGLRVLRVNKAFERMTGYGKHEILGRSPKMLQGPRTDVATVAFLRSKIKAKEPAQVELINYKKDGTEFWMELSIQPMFNERRELTYWISTQRDITERKKAEEQIWWQANYDSLTGLPNRFLYQKRLESALQESERRNHQVGVLFFDLDRFKQINDTLGHLVGDKLLQQVAERLQERLRNDDTIARLGGDEFCVLLPNLPHAKHATTVAQKMLDALDRPFYIDGQELYVTASIGVSIAPEDGRDIATLLKNADTAMYRAKEEGRDGFRVYQEQMNARAMDRLVMETHLRRALERQELILLYQPQLNLATGEIFGVEALIRWENPHLGRVSPGMFIPVAEETGLILDIGDWVLREACRQAAKWKKAGRNLRVSVNLSVHQFVQPDLPNHVAAALKETNLPPELLDLELTESTLLKGSDGVQMLERLKSLNVRLSVDDFGVGYSSLAYLRKFPVDVLKIDRMFVTDMCEDRKSEALVRVLVELAQRMDLEVIAEGVETEMQRQALANLHCDAMQGYLLSPPISAQEVEKLIDKRRKALKKAEPKVPLPT